MFLRRLCPWTALVLLEEALGWLRAGCGLLPPRVLWTPTGFLSSARFLMATNIRLRRCNAVSRGQLDFECDDFVPYCVGALALWNGKEFAQPAARIMGLGYQGLRRIPLRVNAWGLDWLFRGGLFFVHEGIILRTPPTG